MSVEGVGKLILKKSGMSCVQQQAVLRQSLHFLVLVSTVVPNIIATSV